AFLDLSRDARVRQSLGHERVQLRVLCLFHPVMPEQALELRIEGAVVTDTVEVVALCHPFDLQNDQHHPERMVRQYGTSDLLGRSDRVARRRKALLELRYELFEQVNVLGFLTGESQKRSDPIIVTMQLGTSMVEYERKYELLDQAEGVQITVTPNLIENELL